MRLKLRCIAIVKVDGVYFTPGDNRPLFDFLPRWFLAHLHSRLFTPVVNPCTAFGNFICRLVVIEIYLYEYYLYDDFMVFRELLYTWHFLLPAIWLASLLGPLFRTETTLFLSDFFFSNSLQIRFSCVFWSDRLRFTDKNASLFLCLFQKLLRIWCCEDKYHHTLSAKMLFLNCDWIVAAMFSSIVSSSISLHSMVICSVKVLTSEHPGFRRCYFRSRLSPSKFKHAFADFFKFWLVPVLVDFLPFIFIEIESGSVFCFSSSFVSWLLLSVFLFYRQPVSNLWQLFA